MSRELVVQNIVTGLIVALFAWFVFRQVREFRARPRKLHDDDVVPLVQVRRIDNGRDLHWGRASQSSGGRVKLGAKALQIRSGLLGMSRTEIAYQDVSEYRLEPFGLIELIVLGVSGEDHYWALGVRKPMLPAVLDFLADKNVREKSRRHGDQ